MNGVKDRQLISSGKTLTSQKLLGAEAKEMLDLGRRQGWDFALLGNAPMPDESISLEGWMVVPAEEDTSPVPQRSLDRVNAIFSSGLRPKGFVVVHEAPALLPAHTSSEESSLHISTMNPSLKRNLRKIAGLAGSIVLGLAILPGLLAVALAVAAGLLMLLTPLVLVAGLAAVDPILVAITEDDSWVEIDRWWTED